MRVTFLAELSERLSSSVGDIDALDVVCVCVCVRVCACVCVCV